MISPAMLELFGDDDVARHPTALRVYVHLIRNPLVFVRPQPVKLWLIAELLGVKKKAAISALNLLVARGYVVEHERGMNNVRHVQLPIERATATLGCVASATSAPKDTAPNAA